MSEPRLEDVYQLHSDLVHFGRRVQRISCERLKETKLPKRLLFELGSKIASYLITLHRATLALVDTGWAHTAPLFLRGMMEATANYLTVMKNSQPEYMAFKYFAHDYSRVLVDPKVQGEPREQAFADVQLLIARVIDPESKKKAEELISSVMQRDKKVFKTFWFQPEKKRVTACISGAAVKDMQEGVLNAYSLLSKSTHATHFGLTLFKDNLNDCDINPNKNPQTASGVLFLSNRLLVEFLAVRCINEKLGLESEYLELLKRVNLVGRALLAEAENKLKISGEAKK